MLLAPTNTCQEIGREQERERDLELTMFYESIKSKLNRNPNVKDDNLSGGSKTREASLTLQKLTNRLFSRRTNNLRFVLHGLLLLKSSSSSSSKKRQKIDCHPVTRKQTRTTVGRVVLLEQLLQDTISSRHVASSSRGGTPSRVVPWITESTMNPFSRRESRDNNGHFYTQQQG